MKSVIHHRRHSPAPGRQRGAAAVTLMLIMLGLVAMLGLVEIGYVYWVKRDIQKSADLAALAGAQRLAISDIDDNDDATDLCNEAKAAASANLTQNSFSGTSTIECRYWSKTGTSTDRTDSYDDDHFVNAVRVTLEKSPVPFFGEAFKSGALTISANAVATRASPEAAFSVGSGLLDVNGDAPLQGLLKLVGVDLSSTSIASYKGLANVSVTPSGLLKALGITVDADISAGDFQALLDNTSISVANLLTIMADLVSTQGVAGVDLSVLNTALAKVGLTSATISLGDLLNVSSADPNTALDVDVNALDLLGAAITVAGKGHFVSVGNVSLLGGITVQASIIEGASIGIGPVGTKAYNAQIRLYLNIDTNNVTALGSVLKALGLRIQLPLYVDVIDAFGTLESIDCNASPRTATIEVVSTISNICIGKTATTWYSTSDICGSSLQNVDLVTLLGLTGSGKVAANVLESTESVVVEEGGTTSTSANKLAIGTTVTNLISNVTTLVESLISSLITSNSSKATSALGSVLNLILGILFNLVNDVITPVLTAVTSLLSPLLNGLGSLVSTLLSSVLGLDVGVSDVTVDSIQCNAVKLVY